MIYKYTSIKTVIAKLLSENDIQEGNLRIADILEYAADALEKIGSFPQFVIRTTGRGDFPLLELTNYQVELPFDFHRLIQVSYSSTESGPFYPMRYGTGTFDSNPEPNENTDSSVTNIQNTSSLVTLAMQLYDLTYTEALAKINSETSTRDLLESLLQQSNSTNSSEYTVSDYVYVIRGGWLKTNVETGYIMLSYQAIPTDVDGYPLIPDTASFKEAIYWYINMKLLYPEWKQGKVRDIVYSDAKRSWAYFCKQAYGDAMLPDRPQLESFKNSWLRLIPNIHEQDTDFAHLGQQQIVYNHSTN